MTPGTAPPFRADHVGSLIRPQRLKDARRAFLSGRLDRAALKPIEDEAICRAVAMQERMGFQAVTDGEFRRTSWREGFFENVDGFSAARQESDFIFRLADGSTRRARPIPHVVAPLRRRSGIATDELTFVAAITKKVVKIALPAPSVMHWFGGDAILARSIYPDAAAYLAAVTSIYREEIADLARLGCSYLQLDEVALPIMCDPAIREQISRRGEKADDLVDLYIAAINGAIRDRPSSMTVCLHMCRGNEGDGMGSGGYEPIAERLFSSLEVNGYFLEYDTPRAGDFSPLRFMPRDKIVALGLMSTKLRRLESVDELQRRVDEASALLDLDRLCLCPQCGFASGFQYDRLTEDDQERKLARLIEAAAVIWR
jgi:5-methyltetrahydropteroyltriglutamate--homocysteine methyltransferase